MSDFETALAAQLQRNAELDAERREREHELERFLAEREEAERAANEAAAAARRQRHAELADHLARLAAQLKASDAEAFVVRTGWTQTGEEFVAKLSTRTLAPPRSLFIELDRDDDHVLARWTSEVGTAIELWRLLEVTPELLTKLVLQVADQAAWRGPSPPPFPTA